MTDRLDFGYSWFWTYGHLIPAAGFASLTLASTMLSWPVAVTATAAVLALWAFAGFLVMWCVVRMNEPGELQQADFACGGVRVLDLGCGAGRTSVMIASQRPDARVVALDNFSADYIEGHGKAKTLANLHAAGVEDRVEICHGDMRSIPFPDDSFDAVVSSAAIDHLEPDDIPVALAEATRVLRADGQILLWLIVPNLWTAIAYGPLLYLHNQSSTRGDWRHLLEVAGFRIDAEGTSRGLAWIQARCVRESRTAGQPIRATVVPRLASMFALILGGALVIGGLAFSALSNDTSGLWFAGAGSVLSHFAWTFLGVTAFRGWLRRLRRRRSVA